MKGVQGKGRRVRNVGGCEVSLLAIREASRQHLNNIGRACQSAESKAPEDGRNDSPLPRVSFPSCPSPSVSVDPPSSSSSCNALLLPSTASIPSSSASSSSSLLSDSTNFPLDLFLFGSGVAVPEFGGPITPLVRLVILIAVGLTEGSLDLLLLFAATILFALEDLYRERELLTGRGERGRVFLFLCRSRGERC